MIVLIKYVLSNQHYALFHLKIADETLEIYQLHSLKYCCQIHNIFDSHWNSKTNCDVKIILVTLHSVPKVLNINGLNNSNKRRRTESLHVLHDGFDNVNLQC